MAALTVDAHALTLVRSQAACDTCRNGKGLNYPGRIPIFSAHHMTTASFLQENLSK